MATITGSDDVAVCDGADVLVMTAGGLPRDGQTRLDLAQESVAICRELLPPLSDVCLSVPSVVNRSGVLRVLPVPLSAAERHGLHGSAAAVRAAIDKLGLGRVAERIWHGEARMATSEMRASLAAESG